MELGFSDLHWSLAFKSLAVILLISVGVQLGFQFVCFILN